MKKAILALTVAAALVGSAFAQVLNTTAITDQFDTGARGNESPGTTVRDGLTFVDYSGADATGTIRYINAYAGASAGDATSGESPVLDVSAMRNPDRNTLFSGLTQPLTVPSNGLSGASDGAKVLVVSDDGGHNTIVLGDPASTNYFVEVDFYAPDRSVNPTQYEAVKIAIRCSRDEVLTGDGGSYSVDRTPGYGLIYDYQTREVKAVKFQAGLAGTANTYSREGVPNEFEAQYGSTVTSVTEGWHRARIEADGGTVNFYLDGSQIATTTDGTPVANGRIGLQYRAGGGGTAPGAANESGGLFDNLKAGPFSLSAVENWSLYSY